LRSYINKGDRPLFLEVSLAGARVLDRVPSECEAELTHFVRGWAGVAIPAGCRPAVEELVAHAHDEEQGFYRAFSLWASDRARACMGFGAISGCEAAYDFLGAIATDMDWMLKSFEAWAIWLRKARARLARIEIGQAHGPLVDALRPHGYVVEGRIDDFYSEGDHQLMVVWRP
jgi:hypothetical protein